MKRRDFLLLRTDRETGVAELSCERLYMRYVNSRLTGGQDDEDFDLVEDGEPPATFDRSTPQELFESLDRALMDVVVLRVVDRRWLGREGGELRLEVDALLASLRARGGRVDFADTPSSRGTTPTRAV